MIARRLLLALLLVPGLALGSGCTTNPATGERQLTFMSQAEEVEIGRQQHPEIVEQYGGAYDDPALAAYVEQVGARLRSVSELPDLEFTFTVLNSDVVNAFALPGGYVYVTRGLLALVNDEAELAGVLGHEIGHVTARHAAVRYQQSVYANLGALGATVLGGVLAGQAGADLGQQVSAVGAEAWLAGYSREQEFQADELGVRYLARAGYDPRGMSDFLATLGREHELAQALAGEEGEAAGVDWFASHPRTVERVERAAAEAATGNAGRRERDALLDHVDGMLYGEDPSQGFVRGRRFVHPGLRFAFEAPPGFRLVNSPSSVAGEGPRGQILLFDAARVAPGVPMEQHVLDWARGLGVSSLAKRNGFTVHGMAAASAGTAGRLANGRAIEITLVAIRAEDEQVYRFLFLTPDGVGTADAAAYEATLNSFRRLSATEAAAVKPRRIEVITVERDQSVAELAREMAVDARSRAVFEVLNGLEPGTAPVAGERVKIVVEG